MRASALGRRYGVEQIEDSLPISVIGTGPDLTAATDNGLARAAELLDLPVGEVRNRATIAGAIEIGRPGRGAGHLPGAGRAPRRVRAAPLRTAGLRRALSPARAGRHPQSIVAHGPGCLYDGEIAEAIAASSWVTVDDLAAYQARWVEPLTVTYRGVEVSELPPPTHGVAALEALAILGDRDAGLREQVSAVGLALEDALPRTRTSCRRPARRPARGAGPGAPPRARARAARSGGRRHRDRPE
jgi:Gamma-glutamyltranspeptidase